jgi:hypothetical protein
MPPESQTNGEEVSTGAVSTAAADSAAVSNSGALEGAAADAGTGSQQTGNTNEDGSGAESSTAQGEDRPKSALEAVKRVMDRQRADAATQADKANGNAPDPKAGEKDGATGEKPDANEQDLTGRVDDAEWKALPEKTRKRITQFRTKLKDAHSRLAEFEPAAKGYGDLMGWIEQARISQQDFTDALNVAALINNNPAEAYKALMPVVEKLREFVGEVLPEDLQRQVDEGLTTREVARDLVRERKAREHLEATAARDTALTRERQTAAVVQQTNEEAVNTVRSWEAQIRTSDPDYQKKAPLVWDRMMVLMGEERAKGVVINKDVALKLVKSSYEHINKQVSGWAPAPRQIAGSPASGAAVNTTAAPTSALEAARLALSRTG